MPADERGKSSASARPPDALARTIRDGAVSDLPWWESTPKEGDPLHPPPRLSSEAYGVLLRRQGLDPAGQSEGPRYVVGDRLGQGSGGTVWSVHDERLDRTVALKVLNRGGDLAGFLSEARIAASLEHPNVLPIHDLDLTDAGDPCFAMKSIDGISLGEAMRRRDDGEAQTLIATDSDMVAIFISVGQALAYAHHRDVIHQDVKPDNIMLGTFGEVLLVDWGCAVRGKASGGKLYGTPLYMSPEQARREFADGRSDVYCLGASLFHALLGRPPTAPVTADVNDFWGRKRTGQIDAITDAERARVHPGLLAIAMKAIEAEPDRRYASAEAMTADLRAWQSGLAVSAWREPLWRLLHRWYRQHRTQFWTAFVALLLVAVAGALLWREKQREKSDWRVVIEEDFTDVDAAASRWRALVMESTWPLGKPEEIPMARDWRAKVEQGHLEFGDGSKVVNVVLRQRLFGALRVEWDYTPLWNGLNLNCFVGDDRTSAFTFHSGGWGDPTYIALTRVNVEEPLTTGRCELPFSPHRTYRFCVEREAGVLRLYIDGRLMISHEDPNDSRASMPQSVGFDTWSGSRMKVGRVRISTRPLPERISPLDASAMFVEAGEHVTALRQYRDLAAAYAGSPLGLEAEFRAAHTALAAGEEAVGEAELHRLAIAHPQHRLAPYAWFWLHESAQKRGDPDLMQVAREGLVDYPQHPLQRRVLFTIGSERIPRIRIKSSVSRYDEALFPKDPIPVIQEGIQEMEYWAQRFNQPIDTSPLFMVSATTLLSLGRGDIILEKWPEKDQARADALVSMGRYEEAMASYAYLEFPLRRALESLARYDELERLSGGRGEPVALRQTGQLDELRRRFPYHNQTAWALIEAGRAAEVADDPGFGDVRLEAWIDLGRARELLDLGPQVFVNYRALALLQLGREDEALRDCCAFYALPYLLVMSADRRGDKARMDELLQAVRDRIPNHQNIDDVLLYHLVPILVHLDRGEREAALKRAQSAMDDTRFCCGTLVWHVVAYAIGAIDEDVFLRQPSVGERKEWLPLAQALRAEFEGDRSAASAAWRSWKATSRFRGRGPTLRAFGEWRIGDE